MMGKQCSKCESVMTEAMLDSHPIRVFKAGSTANSRTMSNINPCYVCPNCGYIEFYAEKPDKFK